MVELFPSALSDVGDFNNIFRLKSILINNFYQNVSLMVIRAKILQYVLFPSAKVVIFPPLVL